MSDARLAPGIEAAAFLQRAASLGGFGTVLHKGDAERGTLLLVLTDRGEHRAVLERRLGLGGGYGWVRAGAGECGSVKAAQYVAKVRRNDPDCWVLELDIPSAERFIAETTSEA